MYAIIPNKDTLFAISAVQRQLVAAFSEHFAPHLVACPTYPLWALSNTVLPTSISSCRILAPRLLEDAGLIAFPVELATPCATSSSSVQSCHTDAIESQMNVVVEARELCELASPAVCGGQPHRLQNTQDGSVWQLSIVAACVLQESTGWGFAHGLHLDWQPGECDGFPRSERVFRVAQVELEGARWCLTHSRWCKIN